MSTDDQVEIEVAVLDVGADSIRVEHCDDIVDLPRSQVDCLCDLELCDVNELIEIAIPEWLAFERGLI